MSVEVGDQIKGQVVSIKNFGAFVNLPNNQSGLVHISEISDGFVKDINDYLSVGDEINVKVIKLTDDGKINLSLRQAEGNDIKKKEGSSENHQNKDQGRDYKKQHSPKPKDLYKKQNSPVAQTAKGDKSTDDFDSMMSSFLKDSEDNLSSLRRSTEGKRGGRGGRRN